MPRIKLDNKDFKETVIQYLHLIIADNFRTNAMLAKLLEVNPAVDHEPFLKTLADHQNKLIETLQGDLYGDHGELPEDVLPYNIIPQSLIKFLNHQLGEDDALPGNRDGDDK